jgi:DNA invertase Pin-like site-specific DNA recombinase
MVSDIKAGYINLVLTKDLSRLGRNYIHTGQYTDYFFPQHGVRYIAVNDNVDTSHDENDIAPFKNILNEMYARDISRKVRSSRTVSAKQGKFMGSKAPYGYAKSPENKHLLVIDPFAAGIISRIFQEFACGDSGRQIAIRLNNEGVDSPRTYHYKQTGKPNPNPNESQTWGSNTVMQLLKNQVYLGHMVQGKRQVASFKTKQRQFTPTGDWIIVRDTHEPIVDMDIWNQVQERIIDNKSEPSNHTIQVNSTNTVSLFSGIIRCADCGSAMAFNRKVYNGGDRMIYRCSRYANHGREQCSPHSVAQEMLEQTVLSDLRYYAEAAVKDEESLISKIRTASGHERERKLSAKRQTAVMLRKRIDSIDLMVKQLFEEKVSGSISSATFQKLLCDYEKERKDLEYQVQMINGEIQTAANIERDIQIWVGLVKKCHSLESLDRATAYRLIDNIFVSEKTGKDGKKHKAIAIQYNLVGCLDR